MQVRIFESADMTSGLRQIRQELGPDALILSTKTIKSGKFGLLGKPILEITAAVDTPASPMHTSAGSVGILASHAPRPPKSKIFDSPAAAPRPPRPRASSTEVRSGGFNEVVDDDLEELLSAGFAMEMKESRRPTRAGTDSRAAAMGTDTTRKSNRRATPTAAARPAKPQKKKKTRFTLVENTPAVKNEERVALSAEQSEQPVKLDPAAATPSSASPAIQRAIQNPAGTSLHDEIRELHDIIDGLTTRVSKLASTRQKPHLETTSLADTSGMTHAPLNSDFLLRRLTRCGIQAETARTIAGFLRDSHSEEELCNETVLTSTLIETIQNLIETAEPQFNTGEQQRIAFVGPTGVGKTTTLAKVCAHYLATKSDSIALITIDTYRIAAVEQLKVYGEIMNLPVEVVFTPAQLDEALIRHRDKELVLIDTAGRSPRDTCHINELAGFLRPELGIDKHLVLSASTRERELLDTLKQFSRLDLQRTIFTKLDECFTLGVLLNIQLQNPAPLSWLTNGQRVPEDLLHISSETVAKLIIISE